MWTNGSICPLCQCKHPQTSLSLRWLCICGFHYVIIWLFPERCHCTWRMFSVEQATEEPLNSRSERIYHCQLRTKTNCPGSRQGRQPLMIIWPTIIFPHTVPPTIHFFLSNFPIIALSLPYTPVSYHFMGKRPFMRCSLSQNYSMIYDH
jgi:hypothetical protein